MSGLLTLGQRSPAYAPREGAVLGWLVADYNWGDTQFTALTAYYKAVGKPAQFDAAYKTVEAAHSDASSIWFIGGLKNASAMKTVGEQAVALRKQIEQWASAQGIAAPMPSSESDKPSPSSSLLPWWVWTVVAAGALGVVAIYVVPPIVSAVTAARAAKRLAQ